MPHQKLSPSDPSSYSRPEIASYSHIHINLNINFELKILKGYVELHAYKIIDNADEIILDIEDLIISKIYDRETGNELEFNIFECHKQFGCKLVVKLPLKKSCILKIEYETTSKASGLQWLEPMQTAGKKYPFLFSEFQAIHARSVIPCQDTPAVKTTYSSSISAPKVMTVLMSAIRSDVIETANEKTFNFKQTVPIPSYLIAIAVGVLESRKLGPRSHVWSEKEIIEECAYEFANTEQQLKTGEDICGDYVWGIYDLLVLPPSFPFGGMENPCLTFVTPTLLAGDRSLANVVAHEIAHSWTGNLVTNRNFEHFWLNEGFTVFVERKIKGRLTSMKDQDFDAYSGLSELTETVNRMGTENPLTKLIVDLNGINPDDAFSDVPYEKGQTFLRYLETLIGGPEIFEPFLRKYFEHFKYKSIITDDFKGFFIDYFKDKKAIENIDWNTWLYAPGLPPIIPNYDTSKSEACKAILKQFNEWTGDDVPLFEDEAKKLTANQRIYLLQELIGKSYSKNKLMKLDKLFDLNKIKNSELKVRWYRICIQSHLHDYIECSLNWINEVGRMKFVRPIYRDLYNWEEARPQAIENFKHNRKYMMHVVAYTVAKDLHLSE